MRSRAIMSVPALVPIMFAACTSGTQKAVDSGADGNGPGYASMCPNFQSQPTCPVAPGATNCARPEIGCGLDALPTNLPCLGPTQCSALIYPCPDWQKYIGGERTDAYICSCVGGRWSCDDCWQGASLCAEGGSTVDAARSTDGEIESVVDAAEAERIDASFCPVSLDTYCASTQWPQCTGDWASALCNPPGGQGAGWNASGACGGYDVLSQQGIDSGQHYYYDKTTGQLVAIVMTGNVTVCVGGPPDFVLPSSCSSATPLCRLLGEGGADALSDAMDSGRD